MASEKALALVLRTTDWSETSRIATLWTRELGKVRALAKGGRRLRSNFDNALDLLTVCSIVLLRKSSGSLDLLTEAQVVQRFPQLRTDLSALYAAYYVAELLADGTEDLDPHPALFDEALTVLRELGTSEGVVGPRLAQFEMALWRELGYSPALDECASCGSGIAAGAALAFSPMAGGVLCLRCHGDHRDRRPLSAPAWRALRALAEGGTAWRQVGGTAVLSEVRQLLSQYATYVLGRRPRLLAYLGG